MGQSFFSLLPPHVNPRQQQWQLVFVFPPQHLDSSPAESTACYLRVDKRDKNSILALREFIYFLKTAPVAKLSLSLLFQPG